MNTPSGNNYRNCPGVYCYNYILHRRHQQVGFPWSLWSRRLPLPLPLCLWARPGASPTSSPRRRRRHWLRRTRVYTSISRFLSSMSPISRLRFSRCRRRGCKLPYSPSSRLTARPTCWPHRCPWLHLYCPAVALFHPQMAPLQALLRGRRPLLTLPLPALLLLCLPVPKFSQLPRPRLFLWAKNETEAARELNVKKKRCNKWRMQKCRSWCERLFRGWGQFYVCLWELWQM